MTVEDLNTLIAGKTRGACLDRASAGLAHQGAAAEIADTEHAVAQAERLDSEFAVSVSGLLEPERAVLAAATAVLQATTDRVAALTEAATMAGRHLALKEQGAAGSAYGAGGGPAANTTAAAQEPEPEPEPAATPARPPAGDKLGMGGRMPLRDGESVTGSDAVDAEESVMCVAGVASPDGPRVHIGVGICDEDKRRWQGADKGSTVVLDPDGVKALQDAADEMAAAEQAGRDRDKAMREEVKRLEKKRDRLLKKRYGVVAERIGDELDNIDNNKFNIRYNQKHLDEFPEKLVDPAERAAYDEIDRQVDEEVAKMPVDTDLDSPRDIDVAKIRELRKKQKAILAGLTREELATMERLQARNPRTLTRDETDLLIRLEEAPGGVQEYSRWSSGKDIVNFDGSARMIDDQVIAKARSERTINELRNRAPAADPGLDEQLAAADAEYQEASNAHFQYRDGTELASGSIPGQWGSLEWETTINDEGKVRHDLDRRPPDAGADWRPGDGARLTTGEVKKVAALASNLI